MERSDCVLLNLNVMFCSSVIKKTKMAPTLAVLIHTRSANTASYNWLEFGHRFIQVYSQRVGGSADNGECSCFKLYNAC